MDISAHPGGKTDYTRMTMGNRDRQRREPKKPKQPKKPAPPPLR
jgi:hypothetical protein